MQVANHPDLVTAEFDKQNLEYPSAEQLIAECGKVALLDRMLTKLHAGGHKVHRCHSVLAFMMLSISRRAAAVLQGAIWSDTQQTCLCTCCLILLA